MPRHTFTKEFLEDLYHAQQLNPYQIAELVGCDHKTVRAWLKKLHVELRNASEYNYLKNGVKHVHPSDESLMLPLSIAAHTMYICEGWHTSETDKLSFVNQDVSLINTFSKCVETIYEYKTPIIYEICSNRNADQSRVLTYTELFAGKRVRYSHDPTRKNPIVRVIVGGKNFAREFIGNAYKILGQL